LLAFTVKQGLSKWAEHVKDKAKGVGHVPAAAKDAVANFLAFVRYTFSGFDENWHHTKLAEKLDEFAQGKIPRLMILMPPRHSKTEFASRRLPAYIFGKNPKARIIACSYNADLAYLVSRDVKRIINDPAYPFPETKIAGKDTDAFFEINEDGYYRAAGIRGGVGGMGASYAIIDDPIKDGAEALSKTVRDSVYEWYASTLYPRLEHPGSILLVMTPWHEDDLRGRLLKAAKEDPEADQWEVFKLPAIATEDEEFRKKGEALWPHPLRFPIERLHKIRKTLGRWFQALYQLSPSAEEGTTFLREKLQIVGALPAGIWRWARYWDVASTKDGGDYTVGTLIGQHPTLEQWFVVDVVRGQWGPEEVAAIIKQTADADRAKGRHVMIREEEEGGSSGKAVIKSRTNLLAGYDYKGIRSTGEKSTRWNPFATQVNAGNVFLLAAPWNSEFIDELAKVPGAENDDQADSSSGAFVEITLGSSVGLGIVQNLRGFNTSVIRPGYKQR
jgi:predicted phage terminase large subunit-like protein